MPIPLLVLHALTLVALVTLVTPVSGEICCCPDLTVKLTCQDKTSDSSKTSLLRVNGYVCDALDGTDVTLQCDVADKEHEAVKKIRYIYYKAYELDYIPVAYIDEMSRVGCDETQSTCELPNVKWSGGEGTIHNLQTSDNFVYQCMAEITLQDDTKFTISSNTMWLDVYKNIPDSISNSVTEQEKPAVNTGNPYEKLLCGSTPFPSTNPPSQAVWSFRSTDSDDWALLDVLNHPRLALVEKEIADDYFEEGALVLMLFDPDTDAGLYKCEVAYRTLSVGEDATYERALYKIVASNRQYQGTLETQMISEITSKKYTTLNEFVDFTCFARDIDASETDKIVWVYENNFNFELVDPNTEPLFDGVQILHNGKTLRLPSDYKYYDKKFKCKVRSDSVPIYSKKVFQQPVVVPKEMYVPMTTKTCINSDSDIELQPSSQYMMSDQIEQEEDQYKQKLTGASNRWWINDQSITAFTNPGGTAMEQRLEILQDVFDSKFAGTFISQKCRYFSFLQTVNSGRGYQVVEVLKVTRPADNTCADLDQATCDGMQVTAQCELKNEVEVKEGSITVSMDKGSPQCLTVRVARGGNTIFNRNFPSVAPSCSERKIEMTITKSDTGEDSLTGEYTLIVSPEGKKGCSKTINYGPDCGGTTEQSKGGDAAISGSTLAGIVVACVLIILIVGLILLLIYKKHSRSHISKTTQRSSNKEDMSGEAFKLEPAEPADDTVIKNPGT